MRGPGDGILLKHWTEALDLWDESRWPNFTPGEQTRDGELALACPHCGEFFFDEWVFDGLQYIRYETGRPVLVNSGHRCRIHNMRVGGAEFSRHLRIALDLSITNHEPLQVYEAAQRYGFGAFGFYGTFLHTDDRHNRRWFSTEGKKLWKPLLAS